jgi:GPH family glycoside/pentoside/hexuronide:cation symporter
MAAPAVSAKYGKKRTYMISILMAGILSTGFYFVPNNVPLILVLQLLYFYFRRLCAAFALVDVCRYTSIITGTD